MGMNDFQLGLIAGLDGTKSKQQLNSDIDALKKQLNNVEIQAKLGKDVVSNLTKQLNATQISLQNVSIDKNAINNMISQINTALGNININIGANAFNSNGINQAAQNAGRQAGNLISREVENYLKNVTSKEIGLSFRVDKTDSDEFNNAVDSEIRKLQQAKNKMVSVNYTTDTKQSVNELTGEYEHVEKLTGAVFRYNTETGEAITKTMKWAQIGTTIDNKGNEVPLMGWVQGLTRYNKALDESVTKVDNFADKQSRAVTKAKNALSSIQSEYNDKNSAKPIKDSSNIANLDKQAKEVEVAITNLGNANRTTFTDMQNEVDTQVSRLKDMIKEYRNAETVATSLRSKDIDTVKAQYSSKLDVLTNKMQSSGVYTDSFKKGAENLKSILSSASDASGLTQFLNGLDKLDYGFKRAKSASDEFNKSQKVAINVSGLESKINDLEKISPQISNFKTQIANADVSVQSLRDDLANVQTQGDFSVVKAKLNAFTDAAKAAGYQVKELADNGISRIQESLKVGDYDVKVTKLENSFKNLGLESTEVAQKTEKVRKALANLKDPKLVDNLVENEKVFNSELKKSQNEAVQLKSQLDKIYNPNKQFRLSNDIQNWLSKNTKSSRVAREELEKYYQELNGGKVNVGRLNYIEKNFKKLDAQQRDFGKLGKNLKDQFKQAAESFSQWISVSSVIMAGVYKFKEAVSELKELDTILTEISKTSDLTNNQIKELGANSFQTASKYGKTASDYLTGVQEMYRAGFDNAEQMSELSVLAQSAGDMDTDAANDYLIATNAAYDYKGSVEELNKVLDSQNYITNNAAVSMKDMADATSIAASIASQYGVKVDELSSLIAVAVSKTRESGSEIGTALKALFINLQNTTSNPIKNAFDSVGISMTKMVGDSEQLKTPIELLKELSTVFNSLPEGDKKRANILTAIGGKHHANVLSSILSDPEAYTSMMDLYNSDSSNDSAQHEAEKSANNWEGTLNKVSNSWTELVSKFAESDSIITVLNLVNDLTKALGGLADVSNSVNKFFSGGFLGFLGLDGSSFGGNIGNIVGLVQSLTGHGEKSIMYCAHCYKIENKVFQLT